MFFASVHTEMCFCPVKTAFLKTLFKVNTFENTVFALNCGL